MNPFEHIEAYLAGTLDPEQKELFETALTSDTELQAEVAAYRDTHSLLHLHQQVAYKEMLVEYDASLQPTAKVRSMRRIPSWVPYAVAAGIVLLVLVGIWPKGNPYQDAFAPYPDRITLRATPDADSLTRAMDAYNKGEYVESITLLASLRSRNSEDVSLQFYLGVAYIGAESFQKAAEVLADIPQASLFYPQSQWYRALALGASDQTEAAERLLDEIRADEGHPYHKEAKSLK